MNYKINVNGVNGLFADLIHDLLPVVLYLKDKNLNDFTINWNNPLYQSDFNNLYDFFFQKNKKFENYDISIDINSCPYKGFFNPEITQEKILVGSQIVDFLELKNSTIEDGVNPLLKSNKKILGVQQRLTDHLGIKPVLDDLSFINKVEDFFVKNGFDSIFLVTDNDVTLNNFKNHFSNNLIYNQYVTRSPDNLPIHGSQKNYDFNRIKLAEDALLDSISLSYTDYKFICRSNLSFFSLIYNYSYENYEYII